MDPGLRRVADSFSLPELVEDMHARVARGLLEWEESVVQRYLPPASRILDVGCGAGKEAIALAQRGYDVVAVDISEAMLERARQNAAEAGVTVEWVLVDGMHMPPGPFDAVLVWTQVLGNIPSREDQLALLRSCREVLKPGAVISASGHFADYCRRVWGRQTEGDWFYPEGPWPPRELKYWMFTAVTLEGLLREAGFEIIATEVPDSLPAIVHTVARKR